MLGLISVFLIFFIAISLITFFVNPNKVKEADDLSSELYSILIKSAEGSFALIFSMSLFVYARTETLVFGLAKEHINLAILLTGLGLFVRTLSELFKYWKGRTVKKEPQKFVGEEKEEEEGGDIQVEKEPLKQVHGEKVCPKCGGRGNMPCPNLDCKEGYIYHHPFSSIALFGEKKTKCRECRGSDIVLCKMCNATGKVTS